MAYLLNHTDISDPSIFGIIPVHAEGSNISLRGHWDMPKRTGEIGYEWGDEDGIEPYVLASDIFLSGRDIVFSGFIPGTRAFANTNLQSLYSVIVGYPDIVPFETPYGNFSVYVKSITPIHYSNGTAVEIVFREPVPVLTGGELPETGTNDYMINDIPFSSFGIFIQDFKEITNLPELKDQYYTKHGSEGYQTVNRKPKILQINGHIIADSLSDFQAKIKALYLEFASAGTQEISLNGEISGHFFAAEGFQITNIIVGNKVTAKFIIRLISSDVSIIIEPPSGVITADDTTVTVDSTLITVDNG